MTKPPNDFENELEKAVIDYAHADSVEWLMSDKFKAGARWGYERGKAEVAQPMGLFAEIDNLKLELTEARAEVEREREKVHQLYVAVNKASSIIRERDELRALAARMAEALTYYRDDGQDNQVAKDALAAYEAFERENKG